MNPERWARIKDAFSYGVALEPALARDGVRTLCGDDEELLVDVMRLVDEHFHLVAEDLKTRAALRPALDSEPEFASGRFHVTARLGSGAFGDVYRAIDRATGGDVALKVLRNASGLLYLKREFRSLAGIRHPNIVTLHELIADGDRWMFTMELVDGVVLSEFLERPSPMERETLLRASLAQLAGGLRALHLQGLLHRDLKPSNVLVTPAGRVVLLDFGLVRQVDEQAGGDATFAGTPDYMSPEQAVGGSLTEASDWYAVGVMLYRLLTGVAPFQGGFLEVLRRKQIERPVPPAQRQSDAAPELSDLCMRLLERDPSLRGGYQDIIGLTARTPAVVREPPPHRLLGRDTQLDALRDAYRAVGSDTPVIVHVTGSSGIGKTILVREFLDTVKADDPSALILAGRCYESESVPYQGVDDLIDHLGYYLRHLPKEGVERVLPRNVTVLARMFPVLGQFAVAEPRMPVLEASELRRRAVGAFGDLVGRLAERRRVVLVIDDLQWGDRDGCEFLSDLIASRDAPPVLFILSYRSEDIAANPWLARLRQTARDALSERTIFLELHALDRPETMQLAASLMTSGMSLDDKTLARIADESDGNPFLVHEIVRWITRHGAAQALPYAFSVDDVIRSRVGALSAAARMLLELVAVAGQPSQLSILRGTQLVGNGIEARDELLSARLSRSRLIEGREELEVYHDRIRATIVQAMDAAVLAERHRSLALALEGSGDEDAERLAIHFELAGDAKPAAGYALQAARRAFDALAFNKAARFYERAIAAGVLTGGVLRDARRHYGDALSSAGRGAEAAGAYLEAAVTADRQDSVRLRSSAASQFLRCGYVRQGGELLDGLLREVGLTPAHGKAGLIANIARLRAQSWARGLKCPEGAARDISDDDRLRLDLCWTGTMGMALIDPLRSAEFSARYLWLALRSGDPYRVATALAAEAPLRAMMTRDGRSRTAQRLLDAATELAIRIESAHARGFALLMRGAVAYFEGQWKDACRYSDDAEAILRSQCANVAWELSMANLMSSIGRSARGEWAENRRRLPGLIRDAEARGDRNATFSLRILSNSYVLDAADHEPDRALRQLRRHLDSWPDSHSALQEVSALQMEIDLTLYAGRPADAWRTIEEKWSLVEQSQVLRVATSNTFAIFARGRAALALAAEPDVDHGQRKHLLARAHADATALTRKAPPWSRGLANVLEAGIATLRGDAAIARRELSEAAPALEAADLIPFYMAAIHRLAAYESEDDARQLRAIVTAWASQQGVVQVERVVASLAPGNYPAGAAAT